MNIDERLDRLTERHEALTQTVELMAHIHQEDYRKHEALLAKHGAAMEEHDALLARHGAAMEKHDEALAKNQVLMAQVLESIDSLARIAHAHERRISNLENGGV